MQPFCQITAGNVLLKLYSLTQLLSTMSPKTDPSGLR